MDLVNGGGYRCSLFTTYFSDQLARNSGITCIPEENTTSDLDMLAEELTRLQCEPEMEDNCQKMKCMSNMYKIFIISVTLMIFGQTVTGYFFSFHYYR